MRKLHSSVATLLFLLMISATFFIMDSSSTVEAASEDLSWIPSTVFSDFSDENDEFQLLDSEINRRVLATSNYISYGAMQRNTVPCSRRGASYYNCKLGAQSNPYSRGCSAITRCRS